MGPQNGIIGDDYGTKLPETDSLDPQMAELNNAARYAKSKEFQELKNFLETRMDFYKQYLPNGTAVLAEKDTEELGRMWMVASIVIGEFSNVINVYEQAAQTIKEQAKEQANARRKTT